MALTTGTNTNFWMEIKQQWTLTLSGLQLAKWFDSQEDIQAIVMEVVDSVFGCLPS